MHYFAGRQAISSKIHHGCARYGRCGAPGSVEGEKVACHSKNSCVLGDDIVRGMTYHQALDRLNRASNPVRRPLLGERCPDPSTSRSWVRMQDSRPTTTGARPGRNS